MPTILAIDIGNTHIEIGLYQDRQYRGSWRIATGVHRTEDELMAFLQHFLNLASVERSAIHDIAISSVVPNVTQIFLRLCDKYFHTQPLVVTHNLDLGITVAYQPPENVGADRLCNAVAAIEKYGAPCIVVDFGTATTLDVVSADRVYLGGVIAPGLETAAGGLHERASKLPRISLEFPPSAIGRSTEESIQSGIMLGTVKMIDGLIEEIQQELGRKAHIIATGGLSQLLAPRSKFIEHVEPHLVLDGLVEVYYRQR